MEECLIKQLKDETG